MTEEFIEDIPTREVEFLTGVEPKYKCKNKFLQKVLIKIFGYIITYETRQAKVLITKPEDCENFYGNFIIEMGD